MTIAFVTDALIDESTDQIQKLAELHEICVFLPENQHQPKESTFQIRIFDSAFNEAMFQRYDVVVYFSYRDWESVIPVMREVKGVAIIDSNSASYNQVSELAAFQFPYADSLAEMLSDLPKHMHWFNREITIVFDRLESFGLLTENVKQKFEKTYGVPLSLEWLSERET